MSTVRIEKEDLLRAPAADLVVEPARDLAQHTLRMVACAGRAVVVALAVLVPTAASGPWTGAELVSALLVGAAWLVALRGAFAAGQGVLGIGPCAVLGASAGLVVSALLNPLLPGRRMSATELIAIAFGVLVSTVAWETVVRHAGSERRRILVVGTCEQSDMVATELDEAGVENFELVGRVGEARAAEIGSRVPLAGGMDELARIVEAQHPDLVVLTDDRTYGDALDSLLDGPRTSARVVGLEGFFEHALGRVPVTQLTPAWFMSLVHLRQPVYGRLTKRAFDVVAAAVGLLLALPVMAIIALAVAGTRGPLLYRQTRLGEGGEPFTIYKFRTMVVDAEAVGCPSFACEDDPRVTRVGRLLRRTHLDELPQFWNVVTGEMSVVGPRPERPEFAIELEEAVPFWNRRLLVKPGITGWAQVQCGYSTDCEEMENKLAYDLWYLRNRSLALDVAICVKTIAVQCRALLPGTGATAKGVGR
jgi:exopolysaccharide biosynthesis polyprenyl glycosylphosphotransferase